VTLYHLNIVYVTVSVTQVTMVAMYLRIYCCHDTGMLLSKPIRKLSNKHLAVCYMYNDLQFLVVCNL